MYLRLEKVNAYFWKFWMSWYFQKGLKKLWKLREYLTFRDGTVLSVWDGTKLYRYAKSEEIDKSCVPKVGKFSSWWDEKLMENCMRLKRNKFLLWKLS